MVRIVTERNNNHQEHKVTITKNAPDEIKVKCPRCFSNKIDISRKGYGYSKGVIGSLLLGVGGLLVGGVGKDKLIGECLNCGKNFNVSKALKKQWVKEQEENSWNCDHCGGKFILHEKEEKKLEEKGKIIVKCPYYKDKVNCEYID